MIDQKLIEKIIQDDDEHAYSQLFNQIYSRLIKFAIHFVKNYQSAEDVVSDVFVNFLRGKSKFKSIDNVEAFFYTAVRNQALKHIRKKKNDHVLFVEGHQDEVKRDFNSGPDQELMDTELYNIITGAINKLPMQRRIIFEMVKYDQLKYNEVASILSISQKTVEKHMSLALKVVRELVRDYLEAGDMKKYNIKKSPLFLFFI